MVLVSYKPFKILRTIKTNNVRLDLRSSYDSSTLISVTSLP